VVLATKELGGIADVFPYCKFHLRTDPPGVRQPPPPGRRLWHFGSFPLLNMSLHNNLKAAPNGGGDQSPTFGDMAIPTEGSNFEWHWNYLVNSTRTPRIKYTFPGGQSFVELHQPYFKANTSIEVNFSSHIHSFTEAPHVAMSGEIDGFFQINANIATLMSFENDKSFGQMNNVLKKLTKIPGLPPMPAGNDLPHIDPIKFFIGSIGVTLKPGFNTKLNAYHKGLLQGTLTLALATRLKLRLLMMFDTNGGLQTNITATAYNVSITPPNWMIFTNAFELGMMFENELYLAGGLSSNPMRAGVSFQPYFNISIKQEGARTDDFLPLSAFPIRLTGVPQGHCYSIEISANGYNSTTSCQMSSGDSTAGGVVEWPDDPKEFQLGMISQADLLSDGVWVSVLQDGKTPIASGKASCTSVVNGECKPSPIQVALPLQGQPAGKAALLEVGVVFHEQALSLLDNKIKSVSVRFPTVSLHQDALSTLPQNIQTSLASPEAQAGMVLQLQMRRNGKVMDVPLKVQNGQVKGRVIYDLGPMYLDAWKFPQQVGNAGLTGLSAGMQQQLEQAMIPTLNLTAVSSDSKTYLLGTGTLPPIHWDEAQPVSMASLSQQVLQSLKRIPISIPLYDPTTVSSTSKVLVATAQMTIYIQPPSKSAFWVFPSSAQGVAQQTGKHKLYWTVQSSNEAKVYIFQGEPTIIKSDGNLQQLDPPHSFTTTPLSCSTSTGLKVGHYTGGVPPCIFEYDIQLPNLPSNTYMVMLVKWLDGGNRSHYTMSQPFRSDPDTDSDAVPSDNGRRLKITNLGYAKNPNKNYAKGNSKVAQTIRNIRSRCSPNPLKYGISGGISLVEKIDHMVLPGMDGPEGASPTQQYAQPVFKLGNGSHQLKHLLPKSVCSGGVCEGMQPGCRKTKVLPIHIKAIEYKLSRFFKLQDHLSNKMQKAVAYGLALVPSAVSVSTAATRRRLGEGAALPAEEQEEEVGMEYDTFTARFLDPPQYELTQELLEELNRRDAFRFIYDGREHELGPIHVESMVLRDEGPVDADIGDVVQDFDAQPVPELEKTIPPAADGVKKAARRVHSRLPLRVPVWGAASVAGMVLLVAAALRVRRSLVGGRCDYMSLPDPNRWAWMRSSSRPMEAMQDGIFE
jgi:hypothetical protein